MLMRRSCPRCHGDLYQEREPYGYCVKCLQCGHEIQLSRALDVREEPSLALLEELKVQVDPSSRETEGRSGRPGMYRRLPRRRSTVPVSGLAVQENDLQVPRP